MRIAPLILLTGATLSTMSCAAVTDRFGARPDGLFAMRPGEYRNTLELLAFEAPDAPEWAVPEMTEAFVRGLEEGHVYCVTPEDVADPTGRRLFGDLTEGDCTVDRFDVSGEEVSADMLCRYKRGIVGRIGLTGRIAGEGADLVMTVDQELGGMGPVRTWWGSTRDASATARADRRGYLGRTGRSLADKR